MEFGDSDTLFVNPQNKLTEEYITGRFGYMAVFDEELNALKERVLRLGCMVEVAIRDSVDALIKKDIGLAKEVIKRDHQINALDKIAITPDTTHKLEIHA